MICEERWFRKGRGTAGKLRCELILYIILRGALPPRVRDSLAGAFAPRNLSGNREQKQPVIFLTYQ